MKTITSKIRGLVSIFLVICIFASLPLTTFATEEKAAYIITYHVGAYDVFTDVEGNMSVTIDGVKYYYSDDYGRYDDISDNFHSMKNTNVLYELQNNEIVRVYSLDNVLVPSVKAAPSVKEGLFYKNGKFSQANFDLTIKVTNQLNNTFQGKNLLNYLSTTEKNRLYTTLKKIEIEPSGQVDFGSSGWWLWKDYKTNIAENYNDDIKVNETKEYRYTVNLRNNKALNQSEYNIEFYTKPTFDFGTLNRITSKVKVGNLDYQEEKTETKKAKSNAGKTASEAATKLEGLKTAIQFSKNILTSEQQKEVNEEVNLWISQLILARNVDKSDLSGKISQDIAKKWLSKLGVDSGVLLSPGVIKATHYLKTKTSGGTEIFIEFNINITSFTFGNSGLPTMASGSGSATIYDMNGQKLDSSTILPAYADVCAFCKQLQAVAKSSILDITKQYRSIFGVDSDATAEALSSEIMGKILNSKYTKNVFKRISARDVKAVLKKIISDGDKKCTDKIFELLTTPSKNSTLVSVKCPVDVTVYDNDGKICGMVKNNVVDTSYNDVFINVVGDQKNIYLIGDDYTFTMTGTDSGKMDYVVKEFDEQGNTTGTITYENIRLTNDCKYYSYVPEAINHDSVLFNLTDNKGNVISATDFNRYDYSGSCGSNVAWRLSEDGILFLSGSGKMDDYSKSGFDIAPWYKHREEIKEISISDDISYIGKYAFYNCNNLIKTNIPINLEGIGYFAFRDCPLLNTINYNAKKCYFENNNYDGHAYTRTYYFLNSPNITTINIGKSVEELPFYVFYEMDNIKNINIDRENKTFCSNNNAVYNSDKTELLFYATGFEQKYFEVPESVKIISDCFKNNYIETIYFHDGIVDNYKADIGNNFFNLQEITNLKKIKCSTIVVSKVTDLVADKNHDINFRPEEFWVQYIKEIELTDNPTKIEDYLFSNLINLEKVILPDSVTELGEQAFSHCYKLKEIFINKNLKKIDTSAFWFCDSLNRIVVDSNNKNFVVTSNCLYNYNMTNLVLASRNIDKLTIPEGVISIGDYALSDCKNIVEINLPATLTNIGYYAFNDCEKLLAINVSNASKVYSSKAGVLFDKSKSKLIRVPCGVTSYNIPEGVDTICTNAFYNSKELSNIILPDSLAKIHGEAFYGCVSLKSITIPKSVVEMSDRCLGYYSYEISKYRSEVKKVENFVIYGYCDSQAEIYAKNNGFKFVALSNNLATPSISSLTNTTNGIKLSWNKIEGAYGYRVYQKTSSGWSKLKDTTATSFTDSTVNANQTKTYTIRCIDKNGKTISGYNSKGWSKKYTPVAPIISKLENTTGGIKLTWNKITGVYGYRVYQKTSNGWKRIKDTTATSFTDSEVSGNQTKTYTIRCIDKKGNTVSGYNSKGWSKKYTPVAPTISKLENTTGGTKLTWNKITGVYGYRVYTKTLSGWRKLKDTTATNLTDSAVSANQTKTYTIRCIDKNGKTVSGFNSKGWSKKYTPVAPTISKLENTTGGIKLSWNKIAGVYGYRVYQKTSNGWKRIKDTTATSFTDSAVSANQTKTYTIRCIDKNGKTVSGFNSKGWSKKYTPVAPTISKLDNTTGGIKLTWNKITGVYGYRVYTKTLSGWRKLKDTTATNLTDSAVSANQTKTYTIRCIDKNGKTISGYNSKGWSKKYTPVAPTITRLSNTSKGVSTTWNKIAGVYGYRLYRKYDGGSWTKVKDTTSTSFTDSGAKKGKKVTYTVRCIDRKGKTVSGFNSKGWSITRK